MLTVVTCFGHFSRSLSGVKSTASYFNKSSVLMQTKDKRVGVPFAMLGLGDTFDCIMVNTATADNVRTMSRNEDTLVTWVSFSFPGDL